MKGRTAGDPGDEGVRSLLAETARDEYEPRRDLVSSAVKRLRLRRHAIVHTNEFMGLFAGVARAFTTLWSADKRDV